MRLPSFAKKRTAALEDVVEEALAQQRDFEREHPVPFDHDQRRTRLVQTVMKLMPKANEARARELIDQALAVVAQRR